MEKKDIADMTHHEFTKALRSPLMQFGISTEVCYEAANRLDGMFNSLALKREHEDTAPHDECFCKLCVALRLVMVLSPKHKRSR